MNVSIRQLQGFLLVARLGSFTRAAEQMHITQAGLSSMIRDLEEQFGGRLLDRTTRSVSLTRAGSNLLRSAEAIIEEIDRAQKQVDADSAYERHVLKVAVTPVVAASLFPHIETRFAKVQPDVQLHVFDVAQGQIQGLVQSGEVDIGLSIYRKPSTSIELRELLRFPLLYIAPKGTFRFDPVGPNYLDWTDLPDMRLFSLAADLPLQQSIEAAMNASGKRFDVAGVRNNMQTIVAMVRAGHGAAILPSVVEPLCDSDHFDIARIADDSVRQPYYQVWKRGRHLPDIADPFINTFKEVASALCSV